jgi:large subunit ribosomal protein L32e
VNPKNKPTFRRGGLLRVMKHKTNTATSWRKPRGIDSKQGKKLKNKPRIPSTGYGAPKATRNLHPSGLSTVLVYNIDNLKGLDSKKNAVIIA